MSLGDGKIAIRCQAVDGRASNASTRLATGGYVWRQVATATGGYGDRWLRRQVATATGGYVWRQVARE